MANEQTNNILFVQEVEKYPCLYNNNLPEYSRKDITEKTWRKVGDKFNMSGPECKEKWRNIRSVFVRNLKPAKGGSSAKKKKPYYLEDVLQFILPYVKLNETSISGSLPQSQKLHMTYEVEQNITEIETTPEEILPNFEQHFSIPSPSIDTSMQSPERPHSSSSTHTSPSRQRPKRKEKQTDIDKSIIDYLENKKSRHLENNPKKMFLLSLVPEVEAMTDMQIRRFKRRVMELIDDILDEMPAPTDPISSLQHQSSHKYVASVKKE